MLKTFAQLLPDAGETLFLRACLDSSSAGQAAWQAWRTNHILQNELERDGTGHKRLLPLLAFTLDQGDVTLDPADVNIMRAARLREQLRAEKIRGILYQALTALERGGLDVILLKGAALSQLVYPNPDLRHTHDIDLLVREPDLTRAADLLLGQGFTVSSTPTPIVNAEIHLVHASGLPVLLHTALYQTRAFALPDLEIWNMRVPLAFDTVETRILAPELNLVHVLGQTFFTHTRRLRVWVCDAFFLVMHTPALDWERVGGLASRARLALPVFLTLNYLERALSLPIPQSVLNKLQQAASKMSQGEYESALTLMRRNRQGGYQYWLKNAQSPQERLQVARWVLHTYGKSE